MTINLSNDPRGGTFCITKAAVIVDADAAADLEITPTAMLYVINGIHYTKASDNGDTKLDGNTAHTIAAGYTRAYLAHINAAGTIVVMVGDAVANSTISAGKALPWPVAPADTCPYCGIVVTNSTASVFTAGTTTLTTTSIFCDIYDLFAMPTTPISALATTQQS